MIDEKKEPVTDIIDNRGRGNASAMREALVSIRKLLLIDSGMGPCTKFHAEVDRLTATALAEPPRNCDVGTPEEQEARYHATGNLYHNLTLQEVLAWAQMPCEKGESDGKEV